jgi:hypothetical protein
MRRDFAGTCAKDPQEHDYNEDQFEVSWHGLRLALCDGASESYNSRLWAKIISRKYAADPKFRPDWLADALREYIAAHDFPTMSWSQQSAYERGSFCTLLGIDYDTVHQVVEVFAIGDSIAILIDDGRYVDAWPFVELKRFKEHPTLLSTLQQHNEFLWDAGFSGRTGRAFHMSDYRNPKLLCMTDALGEWALGHALAGTDGIARLLGLHTEDQLCALVVEERAAKRMRVDDATLIVLSFGCSANGNGLPVP